MSSRIFQSTVLQIREVADRSVGVIDAEGTVIACNDLTLMGEKWPDIVTRLTSSDGNVLRHDGKTFKTLAARMGQFDYAVFAIGEDETAVLTCGMAVVSLAAAKNYYEEKHDKITFVKNIISDNILQGDIFVRAKELHFVSESPRAVLLIRQTKTADIAALEMIQALFPDRQNDYVLSVSESDVVLVKQVEVGTEAADLYKIARQIEQKLSQSDISVVIGIGTVVNHVRDLARAYKDAQIAIEVGKVFDTEKTIINYENLGIGRLIYQLPTTLCEMFLQEVFKKNPIDALDAETLFTINKFFENSLNVSETARKLFVHRNTLVYRLEKIKKLTGLDLREFDNAITFKVALMVKKYLVSRGIEL
ncbi:MAG: Sugar diacid utilization regulator SdaR [Oscillospiraceae bacterium]|nr:Sugar diacid utilization regulator SdaR [Oscillospiraceae bacterium]